MAFLLSGIENPCVKEILEFGIYTGRSNPTYVMSCGYHTCHQYSIHIFI